MGQEVSIDGGVRGIEVSAEAGQMPSSAFVLSFLIWEWRYFVC